MKSGVEPLVLNWNKVAMENLREEKLSESFRLLQKAEELLRYPDGSDYSKLQAITFNNFGCFYKKTEKYLIALKYLFKALDVEVSSVYDKTNLAGTHLNICAVFSLMNQHEKALTHGIMATKLLKEANELDRSNATLLSLVVSLHNTGLEYEHLKESDKALSTYKCGMDLAIKHLGPEHPISLAISKSYFGLFSAKPSKTLYSKISLKSTHKDFETRKRRSQGLPTIKTLSNRNKSLGSRGKPNSTMMDKKGNRTGSNRIFSEDKNRDKELPKIEKPRTVSKREKKIISDEKVKGLETKIAELQNQIFVYQQKYKDLEAKTFDDSIDKNQAVTIIQRFWRKKHPRIAMQMPKLKIKAKALFAIKELEKFKQHSPISIPSYIAPKPPIFIKSKESRLIPINPKKGSVTNRMYKAISMPLDPIRESKIETKEMKAILIQTHVRRFLARKKFLKIKQAIIKIQRAYRKYQCCSLFKDM